LTNRGVVGSIPMTVVRVVPSISLHDAPFEAEDHNRESAGRLS